VKRFEEELPLPLVGKPTHLDPDFGYLTYWRPSQRESASKSLLTNGDLLAFLRRFTSGDGPARPLSMRLLGRCG